MDAVSFNFIVMCLFPVIEEINIKRSKDKEIIKRNAVMQNVKDYCKSVMEDNNDHQVFYPITVPAIQMILGIFKHYDNNVSPKLGDFVGLVFSSPITSNPYANIAIQLRIRKFNVWRDFINKNNIDQMKIELKDNKIHFE